MNKPATINAEEIRIFKSLKAAASAVNFVFLSTSAPEMTQAYETTLLLDRSRGTAIELVVLSWSTAEASGLVATSDLIDYSLALFEASPTGACIGIAGTCNQVYFDQIILNGLIQPIAGLARTASDPF